MENNRIGRYWRTLGRKWVIGITVLGIITWNSSNVSPYLLLHICYCYLSALSMFSEANNEESTLHLYSKYDVNVNKIY